jgi:adenylate kinase family enzyme
VGSNNDIMKKVLILGPSGTGKTTICRDLGKKLDLKVLHLDSVYWQKDWENIDKQEFDFKIRKFLTKNDKFVIDGNYTNNKHFKYRLDIADTIIFLDFGTKKALEGIYDRANRFRHQVRSDMAEGCVEGIDQVFLKYVAGYYKFRAKYLKARIKEYENRKTVLIFKTRDELYNWYNSL